MTNTPNSLPNPQRGEIWRANLEPTVGREIQKDNRPVLVLSLDGDGEPDVRVCAPLTGFDYERDLLRYWRVGIGAGQSGLPKYSCADVSQTRALDVSRFVRRDGFAHPAEVQATAAALAALTGLEPEPSNQPT